MGNSGSSAGSGPVGQSSQAVSGSCIKNGSCNGCSQGGSYFSFGKVAKRKSPVRKRKSPVRKRKSPVRKRKSPVRKRKSPVRKRKSPVRKRKSPVRKRKSPMRKRKTLKFGSCNSYSQGGNYFSFGKSNMKHLNIPTNPNWLRGSNYDNMTGSKYSWPTNGYVVPPGGVSRSARMSLVAKPKSINTVPHMHFGRVCFGS